MLFSVLSIEANTITFLSHFSNWESKEEENILKLVKS